MEHDFINNTKMTSKQSMLGHCLLSPFSQGQEKEEKLFFRRNTEILCQLFNAKSRTGCRPMSEIGPIRDVYSNRDIINIPSARHVINTSAFEYGDVSIRPHTSSPASLSRSLQRRAKQFYSFPQPFLSENTSQFGHPDGNRKYSRNGSFTKNAPSASNAKSSLLRKNKTVKNENKVHKNKFGNGLEDKDDEDNDEGDLDDDDREDTPEMPQSRHDMLLESHRHPRSIQCDTLGPTACRHCLRRSSLSDASFVLPATGVFSNRQKTVRLPPSPSEQVTTPSVSSQVSIHSPTLAAPLERHTPISVFLRTRKKKSEQAQKEEQKDNNKCVQFSMTEIEPGGIHCDENENSRDEIQEVAEANADDGGDDNNNENDNDMDKNFDSVGFDGLKVMVTFREKCQESRDVQKIN